MLLLHLQIYDLSVDEITGMVVSSNGQPLRGEEIKLRLDKLYKTEKLGAGYGERALLRGAWHRTRALGRGWTVLSLWNGDGEGQGSCCGQVEEVPMKGR